MIVSIRFSQSTTGLGPKRHVPRPPERSRPNAPTKRRVVQGLVELLPLGLQDSQVRQLRILAVAKARREPAPGEGEKTCGVKHPKKRTLCYLTGKNSAQPPTCRIFGEY